jgi:Calx-beta domain/RTX calcium-binding nonapeptide repeat (4 copies)
MPDDYAGSTATTGTLAVGGSRSANIETAGDTDWFRITLQAGFTYRFDMLAGPSGDGTLADAFMRIRDSAGNSLDFDDDTGTGLNARIGSFVAPYSGTFYVAAGSSTTSGTGTYRLTAVQTAVPVSTFTVTPVSTTVNESAGSITFTVSRSQSSGSETVYFSTTQNQGSTNTGDYTGINTQAVTFAAGVTSRTITVAITNDTIAEGTETFGIIIENAAGVVLDSSTFTITDNDAAVASAFTLTPVSTTVSEGAGIVTFTITRSQSAGSETVYFSTVQNQGSSNNSDYTGVDTQAVTFSAGVTSRTITVAITNDSVAESTETFGAIIENAAGVALDSSTFTITDNDAVVPSTFTLTPVSTTVSENVGEITVTITRSQSSGSETVYFSTVQNQGSTNNNDYTGVDTQAVTFSAGVTSRTVTVAVTNDLIAEGTETYGVIIENAAGTVLDSSTFAITDNDTANNTPPFISGPSQYTFTVGQIIPGSQLFANAIDSDGQVASIRFYDSTAGAGYFTLDSTRITGGFASVAPSEISRIAYVTGGISGTNDVIIEAFDNQGLDSNDLQIRISVVPADVNVAPTILGAASTALSVGQTVSASSLFSSATDSDGTIASIRFYDSTPGAGRFLLDGQAITAGSVTISPAQISRLVYVAGTSTGTNDIIIEAFDNDGMGSNDLRVRINVTDPATNAAPIIQGPSSLSFATSQNVLGSQLFSSISDTDGSIAYVRFYDSTPGAGRLTLDGAAINTGFVEVAYSELSRIGYSTGSISGTNTILIEAFDNLGRDSNDLTVRLIIGGQETPVSGANALTAGYVDQTPGSATANEIVGLAQSYVGRSWGSVNCTGLLWAVAEQAGARFFDSRNRLTADNWHVVDAANDRGYVVPNVSHAEDDWGDDWNLVSISTNWLSLVQAGDFVRVNYSGGVHSFLVSAVSGVGVNRQVTVIDNTGGTAGAPIRDVREYVMDGSTAFEQSIINPDRAWVHRLAPQSNAMADSEGITPWSALEETRQLTGVASSNILDISSPILSQATFRVEGVGGQVVVSNTTTGSPLLSADGYQELSFTGGDLGDRIVIGSLAGTDVANSTVYLLGGSGNDIFDATIADRRIVAYGGPGADSILGGIENDLLDGGDGDDELDGGIGLNVLSGDAGNDRLTLGIGASGSIIDGGSGVDTLVVTANTSLSALTSIEALELSGGANLTLSGTQFATGMARTTSVSGNGTITVNMDAGITSVSSGFVFAGTGVAFIVNGTSGIDAIKLGNATGNVANGGDGVDQIRGGQLTDTINGGNGNDKIMGSGGADILSGGAGNDQFRYFQQSDTGLGANADRITDFTIGADRLNFALIDTNSSLAGVQGFAFIGNAAFDATGAAQIRYGNSGADLLVQADIDGDGAADMEIVLQGNAGQALSASDFMFAAIAAGEQPIFKSVVVMDDAAIFASSSAFLGNGHISLPDPIEFLNDVIIRPEQLYIQQHFV